MRMAIIRCSASTIFSCVLDSVFNYYNGTVQRVRHSTVSQGRDSNGNSYRKTCNSYGCY